MVNINKYQTKKRIIIKSLLYRLLAFIFTFLTTYLFIKNYKLSIGIGIVVELLQTILYYFYEIFWNKINWGIYS